MSFPVSLFLTKKYTILDNGLMACLMEKEEFIFRMAAISKDGSSKAKPKGKIISSFMPMVPFIAVLLTTQKRTGSEDFSSTMDSSIQASGETENLMETRESKYILMEASILEILSMVPSKEKANTSGPRAKFILVNLKMVICMEEGLLKKENNHILKGNFK